MILMSGILSWKTVVFGIAIIIVIAGMGGKHTPKDNTRNYDSRPDLGNKHLNDLAHNAKMGDPNYAPKGSGRYKDSRGNVHRGN